MKSIAKMLCTVAAIALFAFMAYGKTPANGACSKEMAAETAKYIKDSKITFRGAENECYSSEDEQVYMLSSREKVNLAAKTPKRLLAVIAYRVKNKSAGFYLVEAEFQRDWIIYSLKRNDEVVSTLQVKMAKFYIPGYPDPPSDPFCDSINAQNKALLASMQQFANQTCTRKGACIEGCSNGQMNGMFTQYYFDPSPKSCSITVDPNQSQFKKAFDTSVQKDAALFTFSNKN